VVLATNSGLAATISAHLAQNCGLRGEIGILQPFEMPFEYLSISVMECKESAVMSTFQIFHFVEVSYDHWIGQESDFEFSYQIETTSEVLVART
jgi:hypothetical protein